jgi:hypothetical protein
MDHHAFAPPGPQAALKFDEVEASGPPTRPLDFPPPKVIAGVRVNALVVHPETGARQVCSGVVHREDLSAKVEEPIQQSKGGNSNKHSHRKPASNIAAANSSSSGLVHQEVLAYWPQRRLQDAIYGSVWACLVLRRHHGVAADDAARAAGVEPGSASAPIVWELTGQHVAIKMVEWARVHHMRGRLLEDPVKEVAAMQLLGAKHPNVLGSTEVLQDRDFLYSVMPYCRDGDLFGVVVQYAEESGGEIGMPEPVARFWFRQILQVRPSQSYVEMAGCLVRILFDPNCFMFRVYRASITCNEREFAIGTCLSRTCSSTATSA